MLKLRVFITNLSLARRLGDDFFINAIGLMMSANLVNYIA